MGRIVARGHRIGVGLVSRAAPWGLFRSLARVRLGVARMFFFTVPKSPSRVNQFVSGCFCVKGARSQAEVSEICFTFCVGCSLARRACMARYLPFFSCCCVSLFLYLFLFLLRVGSRCH